MDKSPQKNMMRSNLVLLKTILPAFFMLAGVILLAAAVIASHISANKKKICTVKTHGVVYKMERRQGMYSSIDNDIPLTMWYPTYEYSVGQKIRRTTSKVGYSKKLFEEGQTISLYYALEDPSQIYVPDAQVRWVFILLCGMGFVFLLVGIAIYFTFRWLFYI